jgi:hypothetical protein
MPVKKKTKKDAEPSPTTIPTPEPVVLQLPISSSRLDELINSQDMSNILEYNPTLTEPTPYTPANTFISAHDLLHADPMDASTSDAPAATVTSDADTGTSCEGAVHSPMCFWCCHPLQHTEFGMPIRYDVFHKNFTLYGTFCSLECAAAYNYATHMGSDRVWEIHSWIQMLAHRYGYATPIRPAPSRYLLKMFNGPLSIEEFRSSHKGLARTHVMNIPPFIHVSSQIETLNTSFLDKSVPEKCVKPTKKKATILLDKQSIESKLPCTIESA